VEIQGNWINPSRYSAMEIRKVDSESKATPEHKWMLKLDITAIDCVYFYFDTIEEARCWANRINACWKGGCP